ncbi:MAG: SGNH/GDSL hydrolase family protein [Gemmatimonadaceae bacterium]|nr:SGNH/GDSL hydrolase family protein [Gemmatimonadaceae bacterium]
MLRTRPLARGAALLALAATFAACSDTKDLVNPPQPVNPMFASYVALGNSITAGFQSGGINDSTQARAYPVLVAQQMGAQFTIPAFAQPGCPAPIDNFATLHRVGGGSSTDCAFRSARFGAAVINDVAVPGATVADLTNPLAPGAGNALSTFILGGKSQVARALDAQPTFVSVWIGNNDVLAAALTGILPRLVVGNDTISVGVTDTTAFKTSYAKAITALTAGGTVKGGVLIGVVNVSNAPIFFPAPALFDPQVAGAIQAVTQKAVTIDTSCTPTTASFINFSILGAIRAGTAPDTIACHALANHTNLLGELYVLDQTELQALGQIVASYNAYIHAKADSLGWAYVDPNEALDALRTAGQIPAFPNLADPTKPFGDYVSLDGIHPANAAHRLLANLVIDAVNAKFSTSIPELP